MFSPLECMAQLSQEMLVSSAEVRVVNARWDYVKAESELKNFSTRLECVQHAYLARLASLCRADIVLDVEACVLRKEIERLEKEEAEMKQGLMIHVERIEAAQHHADHARAVYEEWRRQKEEERSRRAKIEFEAQQAQNLSTQPSQHAYPSAAALIQNWRQEVEKAFATYANMHIFPDPPVVGECTSPASCNTQERLLGACKHQIRASFEGVGKVHLKGLRIAFHSDKFARCSKDMREEFQNKANEIFVVVDELYRECRE